MYRQSRKETEMKIIISIVGFLFTLIGIIWFLQGINILGGSSMTGQSMWAVNGFVAVIIGIALLVFANRDRIFKP
jgi:hypothetical protein